jgi:DNA invertase Pin-like site-specific DNA recombinase
MKACALVVRVSDERQGDRPDTSPDNQLAQLNRYIAFRNGDIGDDDKKLVFFKQYRLLGVSGRDSFDSPEFQELKADIVAGNVNIVMATGLDRFGRNVKKFLEFFEFVRDHDVDLVVTHYQIDTSTPTGQLVITILMALAEMQSQQLALKIGGSRHSLFLNGKKSGGSIPLGYDRHPDKPGLYVINKIEAPIVRSAFDLYLQMKSLRKVARELNGRGFRTKQSTGRKGEIRGGKPFRADSVRYILENLIYKGILEEHKQNKGKPDAEVPSNIRYSTKIPTDPSEWPKIIEGKAFRRVQDLLAGQGKVNRTGSRRTYPYYLSGLVRCAVCGDIMEADKGKATHHYYACKNKDCPARRTVAETFPKLKRNTIEARTLEGSLQRLIKQKVLGNSSTVDELTKLVNQQLAGSVVGLKSECKTLQQSVSKLHQMKDGILLALPKAERNVSQSKQLNDNLGIVLDRITEVEQQISRREQEIAASDRKSVTKAAIIQALEWMTGSFEAVSEHQMRELYGLFFEQIRVGIEEIEASLQLESVLYLARKGPDPSSFDWCRGWYARQELNPQPTGP